MTDRPQQHSALDTRDDLLAIADAWPDLLERLGRDGRSAPDGMPKPVSRSQGLVINELVSQTMAEIRDWVMFLARQLLDETDWVPPTGATTPALITDIARNRIGHFTAHPDTELRDAFAADAKQMRTAATKVAYPDGYRTLDTRLPCESPAAVTETGERVACPGTYTVRPTHNGSMPDLICNNDREHRIGPGEWSRVHWQTAHTRTQTA